MVDMSRAAVAAALASYDEASGGGGAPELFHAPGRVNILGEHTDYNGGLCLPAAIDRGVVCAAAPIDGPAADGRVRLRLASAGHESVPAVQSPPLPRGPGWLRLAAAVAAELAALGRPPVGMSAGFGTDLPEGSGLSSSAAFEVACGLALVAVADWGVGAGTLAAACRRAEAAGLGVPCGPLDQVASCLGVEDGALYLDCADLRWETVPLPRGGDGRPVSLVVVDSGIPRTLVASGYAERVAQCRDAAAVLGVADLGKLTTEDLVSAEARLPGVLYRRVRHVVTENDRVRRAVRLCREGGDAAALGRLVDASHDSLRRDHEVSLPRIDALVSSCRRVPGILGARIVGAGFGGSVLCLAEASRAREAASEVQERAGTSTLVVRPSAGAGPLT